MIRSNTTNRVASIVACTEAVFDVSAEFQSASFALKIAKTFNYLLIQRLFLHSYQIISQESIFTCNEKIFLYHD